MHWESKKNIFSLKREADNILSLIKEKGGSPNNIEEGARKLAAMGEEAMPFVARHLKNAHDPETISRLVYLIELLNDYSYAPMLSEMLINSRAAKVHPSTKIEILATLKSYDSASMQDSFNSIFDDPQDTYLSWAKIVLEDFDKREYRATALIDELISGGPQNIHLITKISSQLKDKAVPLLAVLADSDNEEISPVAIKELGKIKGKSAILALKEIIVTSWRKEVIYEAEKTLRKLHFSGYDIDSVGFSFVPPDLTKSNVFIGPIDGVGNINLCLTVNREKDRAETLCMVINNEIGIIDIYGSKNMRRQDFLEMIDDLNGETMLAEGNIDHFLLLLNSAISQNEKSGVPLPSEFHYRINLLRGLIKPARFSPHFPLSLLRRLAKDKSILSKGDLLLEMKEFKGWLISSPRTFDYAEALKKLKKNSEHFSRFKEKRLIDDFCREVLSPMKAQMRERLFLAADFMSRYGNADKETQCALATAANMGTHPTLEFTELPFVRKLAEKSIFHCQEALDEGFDLRACDEEYDDLED